MHSVGQQRASALSEALRVQGGSNAAAAGAASQRFFAGGMSSLDRVRPDATQPSAPIDVHSDVASDLRFIEFSSRGLRLGALTRMQQLLEHARVRHDYPLLSLTVETAASSQLRNLATVAGNVLQRTRCVYFRQNDGVACNKRHPGSGCAALQDMHRQHAVLGVNEQCISAYSGDLAIALVALEASVEILGPAGRRSVPFEHLFRGPEQPHRETVLLPGELITAFGIPTMPSGWRSTYLKLRDREDYEYALASAAVALDLEDGRVRDVRIGLGGVAYRPWRSHEAETALRGLILTENAARDAAAAAFETAITHAHNRYKPILGRETLVRALLQAQEMAQPA